MQWVASGKIYLNNYRLCHKCLLQLLLYPIKRSTRQLSSRWRLPTFPCVLGGACLLQSSFTWSTCLNLLTFKPQTSSKSLFWALSLGYAGLSLLQYCRCTQKALSQCCTFRRQSRLVSLRADDRPKEVLYDIRQASRTYRVLILEHKD